MSLVQIALLTAVLAPWFSAVVIFLLGEKRHQARFAVGIIGSAVTTGAAGFLGVHLAQGGAAATLGVPLLGFTFGLTVDRLGVTFALLAATLWVVTTFFATGYMAHLKDKARFFGFFAICVGSAVGIAFSSNLLSLFIFYEALTLATYPLVAHKGSQAAIKGGRTYLTYALTGGAVLLVGVVWLHALGGGAFVSSGSIPEGLLGTHSVQLTVIFAMLIAGFGVKAALFPAHGWLPAAMVAPAPVSALLHAVAVVKAGVFGIARVILDVFGIEAASLLGVLDPLALLAGFTIIYASVKALKQDDIKKRLAYSTIGQLSYMVLGLAIGTPIAIAAALAHLVHHAFLKITMFFTAGVLAEEVKITRVSEMDGVGRRMPLTMLAFSLAALGIIGIPPIAGFVSKWGLGLGALEDGLVWPLAVLGVSSVLNAIYLLPMIGRAWFGAPKPEWMNLAKQGYKRFEGERLLVLPLLVTACLGALMGPLAFLELSPTRWASMVSGASSVMSVPWRAEPFHLDFTGTLFLVLAGVVWLVSALSAWRAEGHHKWRFRIFLLMAASGSIGVAFAHDPAMFYTFYAMMALSAYGLITHSNRAQNRRAGRIYMSYTVFGEALLLAALMIGSFGTDTFTAVLIDSLWRDIGIGLLLVAFGIKIGAIGVHAWMPSAYDSAAPGVGAALAGVASSAGIIGLVRFLPGGVIDLPGWGSVAIVAGLIVAMFAALVGCTQVRPRRVLAYSSMSQFGIMAVGIGAGLASSEVWPIAVTAVAIYVVHHGFAKAALFASDESVAHAATKRWALPIIAFAGLTLAGMPFTSGAIAKLALKDTLVALPGQWETFLGVMLSVSAVGTTLLMARFLHLSWKGSSDQAIRSDTPSGLGIISMAVLALFTGMFLWIMPDQVIQAAAEKALGFYGAADLALPILIGVVAFALVMAYSVRRTDIRSLVRFPIVDPWVRLTEIVDSFLLIRKPEVAEARAEPVDDGPMTALHRATLAESYLLSWPVASILVVGLLLLALVLALL